jgi:hypothetical protein
MMDWLKVLYELIGVQHPRLSLCGAALFGALLFGGAWWLIGAQYKKDHASINTPEPTTGELAKGPPSLLHLFETQFPNTSRYELEVTITLPDKQPLSIRAKRYVDFGAKAKFMGFYIPSSSLTYDVCAYLADGYKETLQHMDSTFKVGGKVLGESSPTKPEDLVFSGRIYIYYESDLSPVQIGKLTSLYESKGLDVKFRSLEYAMIYSLSEHPGTDDDKGGEKK